MAQSDDPYGLDDVFMNDCFWDAVNKIESQHTASRSSAAAPSTSNSNANNNASAARSAPLQNVTTNTKSVRNRSKMRPRTDSATSVSSNRSSKSITSQSSTSSTSSRSKKRGFKPPKPLNDNVPYAKQYSQYSRVKKTSSPRTTLDPSKKSSSCTTSTTTSTTTHSKSNKPRSRNPLTLGPSQQSMYSHPSNHPSNHSLNHSSNFNQPHSHSLNHSSNRSVIHNQPPNRGGALHSNHSHSNHFNSKMANHLSNGTTNGAPNGTTHHPLNSSYQSSISPPKTSAVTTVSNGSKPPLHRSQSHKNNKNMKSQVNNANSYCSADFTQQSVAKLDRVLNPSNGVAVTSMNSMNSNSSMTSIHHKKSETIQSVSTTSAGPGFSGVSGIGGSSQMPPNRSYASRNGELTQSSTSVQTLKTKLIDTKRELALKRQECRKLEQRTAAEVDLHKRRCKDAQAENQRLQKRLKEVEGKHKDEYTKQFNTVQTQLKDERQQREQKEHQLNSTLAKNRRLTNNAKVMKDEYQKVHKALREKEAKEKRLMAELDKLRAAHAATKAKVTSITSTKNTATGTTSGSPSPTSVTSPGVDESARSGDVKPSQSTQLEGNGRVKLPQKRKRIDTSTTDSKLENVCTS